MKLLKKLAILTCALAAFSFVACDPSTGSVEPNEPVVDAGGEEPSKATITVAVTADESRVVNWDSVYVYVWGTSEVFGSFPGEELTKDEDLGIWSITKDVSVDDTWTVIFSDGTALNKIEEGKVVKTNESKLYTRARTWIDWDGTSADTTAAYVEPKPPVVPTEMSPEIIAVAVDVSDLGWQEGAPYIWGWGGAWVADNEQTSGSPFYGKEWGADALKLTKLKDTNIYYFTFSKDYATKESHTIEFISSAKLKDETDRIRGDLTALEAGKGYLLKANGGTWTTFTSFDELKSKSE